MSSKALIRPLTALRFYAAFLVFSIHASMLPGLEWLGHHGAELQGRIGVSVFFVLSGFIMTYVYYGEDRYEATRANAGRFIVARLTRIFPLHILTFFMCLPLGLNSNTARIQVESLPQHFFLLQEFSPFGYLGNAPNKVAWTLSCEMFFYLMTPLVFTLMLRAGKNKWKLLLGIFLGIFSAAIYFHNSELVHAERAPFRFADYVLGILAFLFYQRMKDRSEPWMKWLLPLGVLYFAGLMGLEYYRMETTPGAVSLLPGAVMVVLGTGFLRDTKNWFLASDRMVFLGEASFALYMVHEMILRYGRVVLTKFGFEIHWSLYIPWLLLVFIVIQLVAIQFHLRFEVPLQDKGRRWLNRLLRIEKVKPTAASAVPRP